MKQEMYDIMLSVNDYKFSFFDTEVDALSCFLNTRLYIRI